MSAVDGHSKQTFELLANYFLTPGRICIQTTCEAGEYRVQLLRFDKHFEIRGKIGFLQDGRSDRERGPLWRHGGSHARFTPVSKSSSMPICYPLATIPN